MWPSSNLSQSSSGSPPAPRPERNRSPSAPPFLQSDWWLLSWEESNSEKTIDWPERYYLWQKQSTLFSSVLLIDYRLSSVKCSTWLRDKSLTVARWKIWEEPIKIRKFIHLSSRGFTPRSLVAIAAKEWTSNSRKAYPFCNTDEGTVQKQRSRTSSTEEASLSWKLCHHVQLQPEETERKKRIGFWTHRGWRRSMWRSSEAGKQRQEEVWGRGEGDRWVIIVDSGLLKEDPAKYLRKHKMPMVSPDLSFD